MTSWIIVDTNILIANVLQEDFSAQATALLEWVEAEEIQIAAPMLLRYEVVSTFRKIVHRGAITAQDAERYLNHVLKRPITYLINDELLLRAYQIATEQRLPSAYDAQYLAVAEQLGCELWTGDRRLFNGVQSRLAWVKFIGDYPLPPAPESA